MNSSVKSTLLTAVAVLVVLSSVVVMAGVDATDGTGTGQGDTSSVDASDIFSKGQGSESDPYIISDADALRSFRDSVNAGNSYDGLYISLDPTVVYDVGGSQWEPIGITVANDDGTYDDNPFKGVFDGNGATVSGITMTDSSITSYRGMDTGDYYAYGFFGGVVDGSVKNITFTDFDIFKPGFTSQNSVTAVAVGALLFSGEVSGIHVGDGSVTGVSRVAGVVGYIGGAKTGDEGPANTGDAVMGTITVSGNTNDADLTSGWTTSSHGTAAGIIATTNLKSMTGGTYQITNNINNGSISGFYAAGIVASDFSPSAQVNVTGNKNYGNVTTSCEVAGTLAVGIANVNGNSDNNCVVSVEGNVNEGNISATMGTASGIVGSIYDSTTISGNINNGTVSGHTNASGVVSVNNGGTVSSNSNHGSISLVDGGWDSNTGPSAGGIVALNSDGTIDGDNIGTGAVSGSQYSAGKIVGLVAMGSVSNLGDGDIGAVRTTVKDKGEDGTARIVDSELNELTLILIHTRSNTFVLDLEGSSVGNLDAISPASTNTGVSMKIDGGSIDNASFDFDRFDVDAQVYFNLAVSGGAAIGDIDVDIEHGVGTYVATDSESSVDSISSNLRINIGTQGGDANAGSIGSAISEVGVYELSSVTNTAKPTYSVYSGSDNEVIDSFRTDGTQMGIMNAVSSKSLFANGIVDSAPDLRDEVKVYIPSDTTLTLNTAVSDGLLVGQDSTSKISIGQGGSYGELTDEGTYGWADSGQGGSEIYKVVTVTVTFPESVSVNNILVTVPVGSTIDESIVKGLPAGLVVTGLTVGGEEFTGHVEEDTEVVAAVALTEPTVDYIIDAGNGQTLLTVYAAHPLGDMVEFIYSITGPENITSDNGVFEISTTGTYTLKVDAALVGDSDISSSKVIEGLSIEVSDVSYVTISQGFLSDSIRTFDMQLEVPAVWPFPATAETFRWRQSPTGASSPSSRRGPPRLPSALPVRRMNRRRHSISGSWMSEASTM